MLENEIDINEYDTVTGMNLLHFTCKFGAKQIGHENDAVQIMNLLIQKLWIYLFKKVLISQINVYGYEWIAFIIVHFSIRH